MSVFTRNIFLRVVILFSLSFSLFSVLGCSESANKLPPAPPNVKDPDKPKTEEVKWIVEPQEESTGEKLRRSKQDVDGVIREVHIDLLDGTEMIHYLNESGKLTEVHWNHTSYKVTALVEKDKVARLTVSDNKGIALYQYELLGQDHIKQTLLSSDGKSPAFSMETSPENNSMKVIWIFFFEDGKTPKIKVEGRGSHRQKLEMFSNDGKLIYEEKLANLDGKWGEINEYIGTVFNSEGKPTHKATIIEGPYSNWAGWLRKLEEIADDGSVTNTQSFDENSGNLNVNIGSIANLEDSLKTLFTAASRCWQLQNGSTNGLMEFGSSAYTIEYHIPAKKSSPKLSQ
jgi:hypothetical protein